MRKEMDVIIKQGSRATYKGKKVKILEVLNQTAYIKYYGTNKEDAVDIRDLENITPKPRKYGYLG